MNKKVRMIVPFAVSGLFLLLDQLLKCTARTNQYSSWYITKPWLGWEYFENPGIAFSLPLPNTIVLLATPIILFLLIHILLYKKTLNRKGLLGISLIIAGATSNFIDRMIFGITIDYLRVLTSILNLADIMIGVGATLVVLSTKRPVQKL